MIRSGKAILATAAMVCLGALPARAGLIYLIQVDTTSLSGVTGYIDLQFNPGFPAPSDNAVAIVDQFTSDGALTTPAGDIGDVTGAFPGTVAIHNTGPVNDHAEGFTFGSFLWLDVYAYIPTISGSAASGSSFLLELLDDSFNPILTSGVLVEIDLDTDGNRIVINNSPGSEAIVTEVPEANGGVLLAIGLAGILVGRARRVRR